MLTETLNKLQRQQRGLSGDGVDEARECSDEVNVTEEVTPEVEKNSSSEGRLLHNVVVYSILVT